MTGTVDDPSLAPLREGLGDEAPHPEAPWRVGGEAARRRRRVLLAGWLGLFALVTGVFGFPTGREIITAWVFLFLYAVCAGDLVAWRRAVVRDWLPFVAVLFAYDALRGLADGSIARAHVMPQLLFDQVLFGGHVPTVWLQERLYHPGDPRWYDLAITPVYLSHFLVPMAVAGLLWARSYRGFRFFRATFIALTLATLATYAAFPAVPPWLAGDWGFLPAVDRVVSETLQQAGVEQVRSAVVRGKAWANPVAAVPSLHSAVPMLMVLLAWGRSRAWVRVLLVAYPLAMTFTLVYGGEHYISDVLLGWLYAVGAFVGVRWWYARRSSG